MKLQNDLITESKTETTFLFSPTLQIAAVTFMESIFSSWRSKNNFSKRPRETPSIHRYFIHFFARNCQLSGSRWRHACENPRSTGEEPRKRAQSRFFDFSRSNLRPAIKYFHRHIYPPVIIYDYYNL